MPYPCWTCRNRRIQCDQSGTPCTKCERADLECFDKRPLRWVKGVAIRGKMQGHSYESISDGSDGSPVQTPRTIDSALSTPNTSPRPLVQGSMLPAALQDPHMSSLDQTSKYYIDYYNRHICKLFIVYDSARNPFRSLLSFGLNDPVLQKGILALAARHHANTGQSFHQDQPPTSPGLVNANRDALLFKHQAMEALSQVLGDGTIGKGDTTVASIFLFIFLDLLESGSEGWNFHLEGAKSLITSYQPLLEWQAGVNDGPGQTVQEIRGFISNQIHLIETLGATFLRPKLLSEFIFNGQAERQSQEKIEQSFLGCPEFLLSAIQYLSKERDAIAEQLPDGAALQTHIQDTTAMLELIQNFDSYAWASSLRQSAPERINYLCTLSQAFKTGALIYGRRILDVLTETITVQDDLVFELLGLIDILKDDEALFKCILWAIFVAGLECRSRAQKDFLVESLEKFWTATRCLNVVNAAKIMKDYWDQEEGLEISSRWIFDIGLQPLWDILFRGATQSARQKPSTTPIPLPNNPSHPPIRIICISDTHNATPPLPPGDILVHAGDLTAHGTFDEVQTQLHWLSSQPHTHKIVIAGNHDLILDEASEMKFLSREGISAVKRKELDWTGIHYLQEEAVTLEIPVPAAGEQQVRRVKIYGSPMTPEFGLWAFQYPSIRDVRTGQIPDNTDILVVHGPPALYGDCDSEKGPDGKIKVKGDGYLLREIQRVKPKMVVCGHIHGAFGVAVIQHDGIKDVVNGLEMRWESYDIVRALKQTIWSKITIGRNTEPPQETLVANAAVAPSVLRSEDKSAIAIDFH
ncbi:transcriptional regulator family: Fungal Specific TF [Penicillium roqueforti]|uniref:transcriptional regulator family: Fungal Specific TF n=1 Tax=Penicillium roqueforti TaxID=5082 RepID=UPI00190B33AF|nr:transcriptional regulator family: Fungal Specific TF [Penicillium roqueforti]KAF9247769.1 transcriptional regulator family: Fungal Specific TF [Penicillium roqueforti]KAI2678094.1 transcriptional regulator family: Fungal Specific TF [Penicillium roqueforti]KAI2686557.1 transcriptional regulator family: Fungal Specific TF [Penicillium roqueforti]KAI2704457.1 transcriptional regulator family: Fungal Specific TF [Penicillium roqueforti]KAI2715850.1 transcriptional regulator family: Fungal Spec